MVDEKQECHPKGERGPEKPNSDALRTHRVPGLGHETEVRRRKAADIRKD